MDVSLFTFLSLKHHSHPQMPTIIYLLFHTALEYCEQRYTVCLFHPQVENVKRLT